MSDPLTVIAASIPIVTVAPESMVTVVPALILTDEGTDLPSDHVSVPISVPAGGGVICVGAGGRSLGIFVVSSGGVVVVGAGLCVVCPMGPGSDEQPAARATMTAANEVASAEERMMAEYCSRRAFVHILVTPP
jgi:hypothetical protein